MGAGAAYGEQALEIATMVKLTRALWIIPVTIATMFIFKQKGAKISIPWFIFFFILAMVANTFLTIPETITGSLVWLAKKGLTVTLFLIGAGLSRKVIKQVGVRPMSEGARGCPLDIYRVDQFRSNNVGLKRDFARFKRSGGPF